VLATLILHAIEMLEIYLGLQSHPKRERGPLKNFMSEHEKQWLKIQHMRA